MKKILAFAGALLLIGSTQIYAENAPLGNLATVNLQQVLQQSPKIKTLNEKLQNQFKSRQDKLIGEQQDLQKEADSFKKDSLTMTQKEKTTTQKKLEDEQANLAKQVAEFQKDVGAEQSKVMQTIFAQLNGIISTLAKKESYSLVLDAQAVVYAEKATDITKEVSKEFDKK